MPRYRYDLFMSFMWNGGLPLVLIGLMIIIILVRLAPMGAEMWLFKILFAKVYRWYLLVCNFFGVSPYFFSGGLVPGVPPQAPAEGLVIFSGL